jgi:hypothetical protein
LIETKRSDCAEQLTVLIDWQPIDSAPFGHDLELAVIDSDGPHALAFACRRAAGGWMGVQTKRQIDVRPTHWRQWIEMRVGG